MTKKGFTLIEILVVVFIISLLASVVIVSVNRARITARDGKRKADLAAIRTAVEIFYDSQNSYKITLSDGSATGAGDPASNRGWFNWDYYNSTAYGPRSIAAGLESRNLLIPAPRDPIKPGNSEWTGNNYHYMYWSSSPFSKYCIYARLENPNCTPTGSCFDVAGVQATGGYSTGYNMNFAVGNGCKL